MDIKELSLRQKICQMFITGYNGINYKNNSYFTRLLKEGLGGVIFFSCNIESKNQITETIRNIKKESKFPLLLSIDQEGGRVERTEKIHNGKKYLSAKYAYEKGITFLQNQTKEIALELKSYGINMNFAPVLDVNTNKNNPIIGERAYSELTSEVVNAAKVVITEYEKYKIISTGKHFPGHGDAQTDSHKTLPVINLSKEEMREHHIKPFETAIKQGIPAIMAAHVVYPDLDNSMTPASVSEKIIKNILINELGFNGVIITDDMEMNGIKGYTRLQAVIKAVNAGVNMFIYRDTSKDIYNLIQETEQAVISGQISEEDINNSVKKIINMKYRYGIIL